MFINCSNHTAEHWSEDQKKAACFWGEIVDYPFPAVPSDADEKMIAAMAVRAANDIASMKPEAVMCQGEFTLSFALIRCLKSKGITVVAACNERKVIERYQPDGSVRKISEFSFVRFREYC